MSAVDLRDPDRARRLLVVKLVACLKLRVSEADRAALTATVTRFHEACDWLAGEAFASKVFGPYDLQKAHYRALRDRFGLSAQMAVRGLAEVGAAFKRDRTIRPVFRPLAAMPYDARILSFKGDVASVLTLDGRRSMAFVAGDHHLRLFHASARGQSDLVLKRGRWYLYVTVEVPEGVPLTPVGTLGVDLGLCNLATDSDGERHSGAGVEAVRQRLAGHKARLQRCGTRAAKRRLKKVAGREARFRADTNHTLAKRIVRKAQDTGRQIALEDLLGIRDRITVQRGQRAKHHGWAFRQLRAFVEYKARLAGVPVVLVDPRNTSRTCPLCDHCEKANRRSQSEFVCQSCGFAAHADVVGAVNIARRAAVNRPVVADVETRNRTHSETSLSSVASLVL